jgi:nitroimidazol reductase NimA-like FMN-containing flavoprotein (pyridoxamine 5'-phosphate oxidase superfamily)
MSPSRQPSQTDPEGTPAAPGGPIADRPRMPAEYLIPATIEGILSWSHVDERLAAATVYWIATSGPGGQPRVRPVDGLYLDGILYIGGSPATRWARDIAGNPQVSVHLDGGADVVIVEGRAELLQTGVVAEVAEQLAEISNRKYPQYAMTAASFGGPGPYAIRPRLVFAWTNFPSDVTRFRFPSAGDD